MRRSYWHMMVQMVILALLVVSNVALAADISADQWTAVSGIWKFDSESINNSDTSINNTSACAAVSQKGKVLTYEWTVKFNSTVFAAGPAAGMHILADDANDAQRGNSYLIFQDKSFIRLYKSSLGSLGKVGDLATSEVNAGETFRYKVVFNTETGLMEVFRNDQLMGTYTDFSPLKSGAFISLRTNGTDADFTQIKVSAQ